jgi:hypothetical protein
MRQERIQRYMQPAVIVDGRLAGYAQNMRRIWFSAARAVRAAVLGVISLAVFAQRYDAALVSRRRRFELAAALFIAHIICFGGKLHEQPVRFESGALDGLDCMRICHFFISISFFEYGRVMEAYNICMGSRLCKKV